MRTWVRRVRLWLGVLLLAVGVLSSVVSQFFYLRVGGYFNNLERKNPASPYATFENRPFSARLLRWNVHVAIHTLNTSLVEKSLEDHLRATGWDRWKGKVEWGVQPGYVVVDYFYPRLDYGTEGWTASWQSLTHWSLAGLAYSEGVPVPHITDVCIPYYLPLLLGLALCYSPLRAEVVKRRRGRRGECLECGYDRRSLAADQPCPECGGADHRAKEQIVK